MFENLRAFNTHPEAHRIWKGAIEYYLKDLDTARDTVIKRAEKPRAKPLNIEAFNAEMEGAKAKITAMLAVSASARAMEMCAANANAYLQYITESPSQDDIDLDAQDYLAPFLLHKDREKYGIVITDPLVGYYYQQILGDARIPQKLNDPELGLKDEEADLHKDKKGKGWKPSRVMVASTEEIRRGRLREIRDEGRFGGTEGKGDPDTLVYYLHNDAENGGFDKYINRLLGRDTKERFKKAGIKKKLPYSVRWSAARIACDAFLVDKFTRWSFQITCIDERGDINREDYIYTTKDGKRDSLKLTPTIKWGGDPLTNIIQPSFLPRQIKHVYEGDAAGILDIIDKGFRPDDIFFDPRFKDFNLPGRLLHPTAVEDLKKIGRYNKALGLYFGSSRGAAVPEYNMRELGKSLSDIAERFAQMYGDLTLDDGTKVGKHIVGAMMSRLILAKAMAARASMVNPPLFQEVFGPLTDPRSVQPLRELREYLFGSKLDWRSGLVAEFSSRRTAFVIRDNMFGAEDDIKLAYRILARPDEGLLRKAGRVVGVVGTAIASSQRK
jgi:hypothetical protein